MAELPVEATALKKGSWYMIRSVHFQDIFNADIIFQNDKTGKVSIVVFHHSADEGTATTVISLT
ncbi:hypothetical protein [Chitinophaga sancti]|uniref:hypothetical protein n=1 Tax=Chitinophaga sancti TaxID=1004 RepID=UPI003F7A7BDB